MLLTGTFVRSLDDKQRFAIPKRLRDMLGYPSQTAMYFAPGTDGSLSLYPEDAFSQLADQLNQGSPNRADVRAFSRLFYAQAQRAELDRQGRVRIPPELSVFASLSREIVLLGVRDHLEIWDRGRWDEYLGHNQTHYDEFAETAFTDGMQPATTEDSRKSPRATDADERPTQPK